MPDFFLLLFINLGLCREPGGTRSSLPEWRNAQFSYSRVRSNIKHLYHSTTHSYRAWGVPWPTWDGVGGDEVIEEMDVLGIVGYLCKYYYDGNLPDGVCQGMVQGQKGMTAKNL